MLALDLADVTVSYRDRGNPELSVARLQLARGETMAVTGRADIGKRALHNVIAGLERPTTGRVLWGEVDIAALATPKRDLWRARHMGLMSRETNLFPGLSIMDNVLLPTVLGRNTGFGFWRGPAVLRERATMLIERAGLTEPGRLVDDLDRNERRGVALARMLLKRPDILLVDDPTGDLAPRAAEAIGDSLLALAREERVTLVAFTDDERLIGCMDHVVPLRAGRILSEGCVEMAS
ncbi:MULTISPECIES: ATP-binding cassette domain-containing protein [unclassified Chelatococcus]|jgi:putative ABC transport system ATP-binding protein|uniref:ATP-binding cassette domain-containing protein n=1 Tax=unclassified Chelatococcus TaxID=2638111 RepID=UPI001BCD80C5|nr:MULTISPECIES: ATP-binding cassette domain-containing protein [unclassified Chelatococcus]CAH1667778.1 putative ABC transport system ATP-binding protein [Hyphomicrobiales bacterium]MBS7738070.1 ATP-binding cassette domain-containing protein [Chelatococcus sp. HY11]MBX3546291.1 ATP-binding cassette domain-containing protein [Chelatococcus sp.]MCO5077585.1 ATP-binding cassette domain-containing protein [Chelatococcus sp.]CAH1679409.1 putative ABC transport system ATP-binding protein [Hyphomicr